MILLLALLWLLGYGAAIAAAFQAHTLLFIILLILFA